jgi:hypothetical protein
MSLTKIGETLKSVGFVFLVLFALLLAGIVWRAGAIILSFCAGDEDPHKVESLMFFLWPAAIGVLFVIQCFDSADRFAYHEIRTAGINHLKQWRFWRPGWYGGTFLFYYTLPIWMNLSSKLAGVMGWQGVAERLFFYRHLVWLFVPVATIFVIIVVGAIQDFLDHWPKKQKGEYADAK